jgi:methyltransferase (TIGR00027 family)
VSTVPLDDVSDTARWVAYFRALESERGDALFHDHLARRLAGERGREIAEGLPKGPLSWSISIRTKVFDELILDAIRTRKIRRVVNLAAGLDARPYRLALPSDLRWVETDLPGLIQWKEQVLASERPACHVERVPLDLADPRQRAVLLSRLGVDGSPTLVVTEGLLVYLDEATVASLADDLRASFPSALWLVENVTPAVLARMKRNWDKTLRSADAAMKFAPRDGLGFFLARGWMPVTEKSLVDEAERLGREMRIVAMIRRLSRWLPMLGAAYARRQAKFRDAVTYALLQPLRSSLQPASSADLG